MKTIVTAFDIENAKSIGKSEIVVEDAIITEVAKDLAEKLGIRIVCSNSQLYDSTTTAIKQASATGGLSQV